MNKMKKQELINFGVLTDIINATEALWEEKGYDYYDGFERAKSGYIVCCNHIYNNNIRIGGSCEGIREEGVRG